MGALDWILLGAVAAAAAAALFFALRPGRRRSDCCGDCSRCAAARGPARPADSGRACCSPDGGKAAPGPAPSSARRNGGR